MKGLKIILLGIAIILTLISLPLLGEYAFLLSPIGIGVCIYGVVQKD